MEEKKQDAEDLIEDSKTDKRIDNDPDNTISKITEKIKSNPWMAISIVLGLVVIVLLFMVMRGGITGNVVSESDASDTVISYLGLMGLDDSQISIGEIKKVDNIYEIPVSAGGQQGVLYVSKNGDIVSLPSYKLDEALSSTQDVINDTEQEGEPNWSIFENTLPEDLKQKLLDFALEKPIETDNQRVLEFESYEECKNNLIVFYHSGCGWCTKYYPVLKQAQEDYPNLNIYALVLSEESEIAEKYGAGGTPANVINCKYFASGYMDKEVLYEILDDFK